MDIEVPIGNPLEKMMKPAAKRPRSPPIVHVVDDDASIRRALARLLSSVGLGVETYGSALVYLESAEPCSAACVLIDVHIPEMSGLELLEELTEVAPDLPVVCMSAGFENEIQDRLAAFERLICLRKPFDESELFRALSQVAGLDVP